MEVQLRNKQTVDPQHVVQSFMHLPKMLHKVAEYMDANSAQEYATAVQDPTSYHAIGVRLPTLSQQATITAYDN